MAEAIQNSPFEFVKAKNVRAGDEFVIRFPDGKIQKFIPIAEVGRTCSDYSQVHISIRGGARPLHSGKHTDSLRIECWFGETEVEVRRNGTAHATRTPTGSGQGSGEASQ